MIQVGPSCLQNLTLFLTYYLNFSFTILSLKVEQWGKCHADHHTTYSWLVPELIQYYQTVKFFLGKVWIHRNGDAKAAINSATHVWWCCPKALVVAFLFLFRGNLPWTQRIKASRLGDYLRLTSFSSRNLIKFILKCCSIAIYIFRFFFNFGITNEPTILKEIIE